MPVPYKLNYFEIETGIDSTSTFIHTGDFTATKVKKYLGTSAQILAADGSVITAGTNITIVGGLISSSGGGGTVTSVAALTLGTSGTDLSSSVANGTTTPVITLNVPTASASNRGALSSGDWTTFNGKQNSITLTTTGSSGASTLIGSTLNIPNYVTDLSGYVTLNTAQTITALKTFTTVDKTTFTNADVLQAVFNNGSSILQIGSSSGVSRITSSGSLAFITNYPTNTIPNVTIDSAGALTGTSATFTKADNTAVSGNSVDSYGIYGSSTNSSGIYGNSNIDIGVFGLSTSGNGIKGQSISGVAGYFRNNIANTSHIVDFEGADELQAFITYDGKVNAKSFVKTGGTSSQFLKADGSVDSTAYGTGTVTSVGLSMPAAFSVASSPITGSGTIAVTGAGLASQYIRGDGQLADFPTGGGGGGSSVSYYLNGSVNQGTFVGNTYYEMNKTPIFGAGTDFTIATNGYITQFITDANDPNSLLIQAGNWNFETYFSASSVGGSPSFYVELYKYNGTTFTLIASNSATPELISFGTSIQPYFSSLAVPETVLLATDRLAVRFYVANSGRTITLHTENGHLSQIVTTFTTGLQALNGLTKQTQYFAVGTSGTDFGISSSVDTHTFNLPSASAANRGALSSTDWSTFNGKQNAITLTTTGSSGVATLIGSTLNIPNYASAGTGRNQSTFTATAGQTTFSATYTVGQVDVYYNGSKLAPIEFTATNGTSIILATPCQVNDIIDIVSYVTAISLSVATFNSQSGTITATATSGIIVYEFTGSGSLVLPTAIGNTALFKVKNRHSANITVTFTSGQNADGTTTISLIPFQALEFISNNTNYNIY